MADKRYRVVQWATGLVGQAALRHFIENPALELAGVFVTNPDKVGKDAGVLAGTAPTGILATGDPEAIVALDADCVHFSPLLPDLDMVCRLLRSGKNVVSPLGPFFPTDRTRENIARIEEACRAGGTSFHGSGIHPGFAGDIMPLTFARLMSRIEKVRVYELVDFQLHPNHYIEMMGFGRDPEALRANPLRSPEAGDALLESMTVLAEALGKPIDRLTTEIDYAVATQDIAYASGVIRAGTVAGQHYAWTAWVEGAPLITFYTIWVVGQTDMEPNWDVGHSRYKFAIDGDPPIEVTLEGQIGADGVRTYPGLPWTALAGVTAIPDVCDARPGFVTHFDLGVARPRGLIRPPS